MLLDDKPFIDKYFHDNWHDTKIVYDGLETEITSSEWVKVELIPIDRVPLGLDRKEDIGVIKVFCYSSSPTMAYKLAKKVTLFLECKEIQTDTMPIKIEEGVPDGNGAIPLGNRTYETLITFRVKKYN